ncbi:type II toxin-antitoxin system PrlF family antitoxin [Megalodesulfovibrio gigas]|uniref:Putative AbrB family transcriptional regulator n=1 Tax=Megalodesulfovibrio gigas (strain ATCC 19364 / DSM 1382 / NCIMB 9332 / VKM B-1759) TaxID=1121448 RepID=T2GCD7_MEGG1|nr:type II toxin-antitoxin system PrlF family antitoxin [Megalodesulfovibrio gigas]AGW13791.1 putative AbrB family transcriptional regulator [Megalodesulfovibrio gigas DSM 1382 = ATCC 19364]
MGTIHELASITSKGQITLPKSIRQLLGVGAGDKVAFELDGSRVVVSRAGEQPHTDPAIVGFLTLLEQDIRSGRHLGTLPEGLAQSMLAAADASPMEDEIEGDVAL